MKYFVLLAVVFFTSFSKAQDSFVFYDFSDLTNIQLNGQAAMLNPNSNDVLSLTDDLWQSSSAYLMEPITLQNLASFSAAFQFQITDPQGISDNDGQGADGISFVVQSNSNTVGGLGGAIGYGGVSNSLAIEFDTWRNSAFDGNDGNHVGIDTNGSLHSIAMTPVEARMNNGAVWTAWVDYDGLLEVVEVRLSQGSDRPADPIVSASVDLSDTLGTDYAFVGFSSGTGAAGGDHDILSFAFNNDYQPIEVIAINEPNSFLLVVFLMAIRRIINAKGQISVSKNSRKT